MMKQRRKRIQEEIQRRIQAIMNYAVELYDLMEPGMTIAVSLEEAPLLIAPNQMPKVKRLFITKPVMLLEVK